MPKIVKFPKKRYFSPPNLAASEPGVIVFDHPPCQAFAPKPSPSNPTYRVYRHGVIVTTGTLGHCLRWVAIQLGDPAGVVTAAEERKAGYGLKAMP